MAKNLWGDLSSLNVDRRTPKMVLQEQAQVLAEATKGLLVGFVSESAVGPLFGYDLKVVVPALNNYTLTILRMVHPLEFYPVHVTASRTPVDQTCQNEAELEAVIGSVLSSDQVRVDLSRLMSQVA